MRAGDEEIELAGERATLLPERAVYLNRLHTLLVADAHWGKAATFRSAGLPVPRGTTTDNLNRLRTITDAFPVHRIVFLGDFLHAREGRARRTLDRLLDWRGDHPDIELILVRGNHDRSAGDPPEELAIRCVEEPWAISDRIALAHFPHVKTPLFSIAGHIHPAVKLVGMGRQRARLPCFWIRRECAVLPAFGDFTGTGRVDPEPGEQVFVVAENEVVRVA